MGAYTGRDNIVEYAIAKPDAVYGSLTFKRLGMVRDKGINVQWDTVDSTADMSPGFTKENLVTFKSGEFNLSGVARTEAIFNQAEVKAHVYNPGSATDNQPFVWLRQTGPDGVTYGPFILNGWNSAAPYADVVTWETTAMSNGAINFVPA
jgi:predicted secreted protein